MVEGIAIGLGERYAPVSRRVGGAAQPRNQVVREEGTADFARFEGKLCRGGSSRWRRAKSLPRT